MARQWTHGDTNAAAYFAAYSTELTALYGAVGDVDFIPCVPGQYGSGNEYYFFHQNRWLHYLSTGQIKSIDGTQQATLSPVGDTFTAFDLQSLSWLAYGQMYKVVGCAMASEEETP